MKPEIDWLIDLPSLRPLTALSSYHSMTLLQRNTALLILADSRN